MATDKYIKVLRTLSAIEQGKAGGAIVNAGDAEECSNFGWVRIIREGYYQLTEKGREFLRKIGSN